MSVRLPAVAGLFYPGEPDELRSLVRALLSEARDRATHAPVPSRPPLALIVPHAGYVYSGPIAASAYALLGASANQIDRVLLLGPAHRVALDGAALSPARSFRTPLGDIPIDEDAARSILRLPYVSVNDSAHAREHSLEVQLPFLQEALGDFRLLPLALGRIAPASVQEILTTLAPDERTLIVISSDLSHFHDYETARGLDGASSRAILALNPDDLQREHACGRHGIRGLLTYARSAGWAARLADLRNSGDTAGDRARVVGYGAYYFESAATAAV
jgi:AmmeMemoRadiSam system protein B